jgi:ATP-dependent RNA helicase DeaD
MIQSRTGSGKTGAFLLPILEHIDTEKRTCQALILVPTRELAQQVAREAEMLRSGPELNVVTVYGGVGYGAQLEGLRKGAHLVVGTPGRILDHLMRGTLSLKELAFMVFDEADRLLSMGFYPDMRQVQQHLPRKRSTFMFSATFPAPVRALAREFMSDPGFLSLSRDNEHVTDITHVAVEVDGMDKDRALVRLIEIDNPAAAIIFCNTKMKVHYVATILKRFGYDADELTSDLSQKDREEVLRRVHAGELRFLVATDVAARGLDIEGLPYVYQFELPDELETYGLKPASGSRAASALAWLSQRRSPG